MIKQKDILFTQHSKAPVMKTYSLAQLKDKHLGKVGTEKRDKHEYELRLDLLGEMIRQTRKERL